jgi:inner membrane protein
MDSLSQIVLGVAVANELLGKKLGNRAILYGAIVGTIPDLDVLYGQFLDPITATDIHRGFSHSSLFFILITPLLAIILMKIETHKNLNFKESALFVFLGLQTHALLDLFTTWGTQLLWPLKTRFSLESIFVIDPLYTLPFLICLIYSMRHNRLARKRIYWNRAGLILSTGYLLFTLFVQSVVYRKFENQLLQNQITYQDMVVKPSPFNIILWTTHVKLETGYWVGEYSFFDTQPIQFQWVPKQKQLIKNIEKESIVQQLMNISEGWYCITIKENSILFNDLRFGIMNLDPNNLEFSFSYEIYQEKGQFKARALQNKSRAQAKKLLDKLWTRLIGN